MKVFTQKDLKKEYLPGRCIQKAVGIDGYSPSGKMTMGFARYSAEVGPMEPHQHAEEIIYIIDTKDGWIRFSKDKDSLGEKFYLKRGMVLHIPELEWHMFGYDGEGFLDAIFFYGQVENIRPEDILKNR